MISAREKFHAQIMGMIKDRTDAERSTAALLHDEWRANGHYEVGDVRRRGEALYRCLTGHDAQPSWTPEDSPSLWARIMYREGIRIIPEVIDASSAFNIDELGWWNDVLYRCKMNGCVWNPDQYPAAWEKAVTE